MRNCSLLALALFVSLGVVRGADVLTVNYGNDRTNANTNETVLTPSNVNPAQFGKLLTLVVDGQIYAQPLYVHGLDMGALGVRDVVYVATMHNSLYAFDADSPAASALLWSVNLGPAVPSAYYNFNDIDPEVGILSTPVIDRNSGTLYLVANTLENDTCLYRLHALDLVTGAEKFGAPMVIQASVPGQAPDASDGAVAFQAEDQLQRPGLLLLNGVVYIAFGSHGDDPPYHGWLVGYSAGDLTQQLAVFNVTPDGSAGSIWQAGHGPAADNSGNIYLVAANGDFDGQTDWSESFLRLSTANGVTVADSFTPAAWSGMNDADQEIGNSGPMLLPGGLLLGGGKQGDLYLTQCGNLGGASADDSQILQTFQVVNFGFFARAWWSNTLYVSGWGETVKAYQFTGGFFDTAPASETAAAFANPYIGLAVSSNGDHNGILWATTAEDIGEPVSGTLRAFDATDISHELWNSDMSGGPDTLGNFAKFALPTIADGKVFVPTHSNQLVVYGLL